MNVAIVQVRPNSRMKLKSISEQTAKVNFKASKGKYDMNDFRRMEPEACRDNEEDEAYTGPERKYEDNGANGDLGDQCCRSRRKPFQGISSSTPSGGLSHRPNISGSLHARHDCLQNLLPLFLGFSLEIKRRTFVRLAGGGGSVTDY